MTLLEVVLAGAMLLVVLVPSAALLETSSSVLDLNRAKVVAASLVSGQLESDRAVAATASWTTSENSNPQFSYQVPVLAPVSAPDLGEAFTVTQSGAWCGETTESGATGWASYSGGYSAGSPPAYIVTVAASWLGGSYKVEASEALTTPVGIAPPEQTPSGEVCP